VRARPVASLVLALLGCAGGPDAPLVARDYGFEETSGRVWVRGPWDAITPSRDIDEVIDQLCPAVMTLPRARERDYEQEYCGLIYSLGDGLYYASRTSALGQLELVGPSRRKSCIVPQRVLDARGRAHPIADFHSHPWAPSPLSQKDLLRGNQWWIIRIQFDTACHVQKLIPHADDHDKAGEVYERQGQRWILVGRILPEDKAAGRITAVEDDS
jgi:hypothetical protein